MYVGPWEEYRLMKAMEELCWLRNHVQADSMVLPLPCDPVSTPGSSHHLRPSLETAGGSSPARRRLADSANGNLPGCGNSSDKVRSPSRGSENRVGGGLPVAYGGNSVLMKTGTNQLNAVPGHSIFKTLGEFRTSSSPMCERLVIEDPGTARGHAQPKCCVDSGRQPLDARQSVGDNCVPSTTFEQTVHVELGTGVILRKLRKKKTVSPSPLTSSEFSLLDSVEGITTQKRLNMLRELGLAPPLDTRSKYVLAKQKLPPSSSSNKEKEKAKIEEIQEQIERRLRLQMLYSAGRDSASPFPYGSAEAALENSTGSASVECRELGAAQTTPHVPWDLPNVVSISSLAQGTTSTPQFVASTENRLHQAAGVNAEPQRLPLLTHPGVANMPASSLPLREGSERVVSTGFTAEMCPQTKNIEVRRQSSVRTPPLLGAGMHNPSVSGGMQPQSLDTPAVTRQVEAEQFDDDMVGDLINWAEQLDPDSIV
ncbi:hypothetical protein, conserved [Trypanosoma brucei brucei TREU927]|uniref:Uncharacterized protein n=1 Tax=Trypanosoma brucei brucei (strain 927/4 GUTat10.1) TaxID=185431 RepID=Q387W8_TRYB2|nr:hypothetical protein, conserved [Trypanosoma brucei brucei TREU927]EAN78904.1 hypothetical protein, conserved [Trypanosoma brucei brucei TREU927]